MELTRCIGCGRTEIDPTRGWIRCAHGLYFACDACLIRGIGIVWGQEGHPKRVTYPPYAVSARAES